MAGLPLDVLVCSLFLADQVLQMLFVLVVHLSAMNSGEALASFASVDPLWGRSLVGLLGSGKVTLAFGILTALMMLVANLLVLFEAQI